MKIYLATFFAIFTAMAVVAEEVPHPMGCPPESTWPFWYQMDWDNLVTYNQCYSSQLNWGQARNDHKLSDPSTISVQFSAALAGAVASLKIGNVEYISSGGHGSAVQYAIHPQVPNSSYCPPGNPNCVASECYNPTEAGNMADDYRDMAGFLQIPNLKAQMHGPSTSAIWRDSTYWRSGATSDYQWFRSWNRTAYFVPEGWIGYGECVPDYPATSPHNLGLTNYVLDKEVRLGPVKEGQYALAFGFPVLSFNTNLFIGLEEQESETFDNVLIAYLRDEFQSYHSVRGPLCAGAQNPQNCSCYGPMCLEDVTEETLSSSIGFGGADPLIIDNGNGYAIGLFAVKPTTVSGSGEHNSPFYWVIHDDGTNSGFTLRTLQVTYYSSDVTPGQINYKAYFVVGNLDWVRYVIYELQQHPNITW